MIGWYKMDLLKDKKFQAMAVGLIVVVIRYYLPEIDEASLYSIVGVIVAFILGTSAVEFAEKRDK
jgi:uncharacterized ion transporter superfamily protein YfcC